MKKFVLLSFLIISIVSFSTFVNEKGSVNQYYVTYESKIEGFKNAAVELKETIVAFDSNNISTIHAIKSALEKTRSRMKAADFWFRYLDPIAQKSINGPLPVEWETEVFEKFEKPYRREGAGLTLAAEYLEEPDWKQDIMIKLIDPALAACNIYKADSVTKLLKSGDHFFMCNRLFLLNLATIYTTGFECPDTASVISELRKMVVSNKEIYHAFNVSFPKTPLTHSYLELYEKMEVFISGQPDHYLGFDQYHFIRDYVNPLFSLNQQLITQYRLVSRSFVDYSLNKTATSIFDKNLYRGQNPKGIFLRVDDQGTLRMIDSIGRLFFYDPILSGNNKRSCVSCHNPQSYFIDTATTALNFNGTDRLPRNTLSLINAQYNQLAMMDGRHISLQNQARDVITNPGEMAGDEKLLIKKILSCPDYAKTLSLLMSFTPEQEAVTVEHVTSALTFYYSKFGNGYSKFDDAMNKLADLNKEEQHGFNLFMSKAQCGTCHFAPQFNGVKPPYVGSEFEVLGVPADTSYSALSADKGRYEINAANETLHAFRTGTLRNIHHTAPYMHNGVFQTLEAVVDFYNEGGGAGKGLEVSNQTLAVEKLNLTDTEKRHLISFLKTLDENLVIEPVPNKLPLSRIKELNRRKVGGEY